MQASPTHGTPETCCIHVVNLHPRTSEEDLQDAFSAFGEVISATVVRDPHTNESRSFAFVTMGLADAEVAIDKLNGSQLDGKTITVQKSRRPEARKATPGCYMGYKKEDFQQKPKDSRYPPPPLGFVRDNGPKHSRRDIDSWRGESDRGLPPRFRPNIDWERERDINVTSSSMYRSTPSLKDSYRPTNNYPSLSIPPSYYPPPLVNNPPPLIDRYNPGRDNRREERRDYRADGRRDEYSREQPIREERYREQPLRDGRYREERPLDNRSLDSREERFRREERLREEPVRTDRPRLEDRGRDRDDRERRTDRSREENRDERGGRY